jgi:hypothetical protein
MVCGRLAERAACFAAPWRFKDGAQPALRVCRSCEREMTKRFKDNPTLSFVFELGGKKVHFIITKKYPAGAMWPHADEEIETVW